MPEHRFEPLARTALLDITPEAAIGGLVATRDEGEGVVSLQFESLLSGYPGWRWTVSVAQIDDADPTIVETELTPGEGALLAPDWVPWSERLAEYKAAQEAAEAAAAADDAEGAVDDEESDDDLDDDLLGSDVLHGGDLDGVDIDEADLDDEDDDDEDDEDDDLDDEDDDLDDEDDAER